jgi:hypothetical protein
MKIQLLGEIPEHENATQKRYFRVWYSSSCLHQLFSNVWYSLMLQGAMATDYAKSTCQKYLYKISTFSKLLIDEDFMIQIFVHCMGMP